MSIVRWVCDTFINSLEIQLSTGKCVYLYSYSVLAYYFWIAQQSSQLNIVFKTQDNITVSNPNLTPNIIATCISEKYMTSKYLGMKTEAGVLYPVAFIFNVRGMEDAVFAQLFYKKKVKMVVHGKTQSNMYCFTDFVALKYALYYFASVGSIAQQDSDSVQKLRLVI